MSMPSIENEAGETEEEEMEQDSPEADNSSDDESDGDGSEEESELELDEEECSKRRNECLDDMTELERQFSEIREQLYKERLTQIENKLEEVAAGKAIEYIDPLQQLQEQMHIRTKVAGKFNTENKLEEVAEGKAIEYIDPLQQLQEQMHIRTKVAGILREYRIHSLTRKSESEELAANQHMQSEKMLLFDSIKGELEDKIRRLEEDRHNIDISSDLWNETHSNKKNKRKQNDPMNPDRRRKPITVSGPYIVYMLKDVDIIEDWTTIKKALKQQSQKRRSEYKELMMR